MFPSSLPYSESNFINLALDQPDVHVDMPNVFGEGTAGTSDSDKAGLDGSCDSFGNIEFFGLENVPHLVVNISQLLNASFVWTIHPAEFYSILEPESCSECSGE